MNKYTIAERQAIKDRLADEKHFEHDRQLLARVFPRHSLMGECNRVNAINRLSLCRRIIYQLLTRISEAEIIANREGQEKHERSTREAADADATITGPSSEEDPTTTQRVATHAVPKKATKADEFPRINWTDNTNPDIQLCILLYDERVNTWHRMLQIEPDIDTAPELAEELAALDDRNRMAQHELEVYQDMHIFPCKHPIAVQFLEERATMTKFRELKRTEPGKFMKQAANIHHNSTRIRASLKKKNLSEEERARLEKNLQRSERLAELMQRVLQEG